MNHWTNGKRWLSFALAMTMLLSLLCVSASANAPSGSLEEAKASLADVTITQTYNTKPAANAVHDYRTDGSDVFVTYAAELRMTDVMAEYLTMRQTQLCKADFNVKMNVELDWLDWTAAGNQLTFTFQARAARWQHRRGLQLQAEKLRRKDEVLHLRHHGHQVLDRGELEERRLLRPDGAHLLPCR